MVGKSIISYFSSPSRCIFSVIEILCASEEKGRGEKHSDQKEMDGHDSGVQKQSTADVTDLVQNLLLQMQSRFQTMSDSIISKIDKISGRISELEKSIDNLRTEMGIEGSLSPTPSKTKEAEDSG